MLLISALVTFNGAALCVLCRHIIVGLLVFQIFLHHWKFLIKNHDRLFDILQWIRIFFQRLVFLQQLINLLLESINLNLQKRNLRLLLSQHFVFFISERLDEEKLISLFCHEVVFNLMTICAIFCLLLLRLVFTNFHPQL